jgi:uncharacterized membrane protein
LKPWAILARALRYTVTGALIGGLGGWFLFGGTGYNPATGNFGWGPIMAPTFAVIGALMGLFNMILVLAWRAIGASRMNPNHPRGARHASSHSAEWNNQSNWIGGILYKSRVDRRIFVPQRLGGWYTINLGQPLGAALAGALFIVLAITLFSIF